MWQYWLLPALLDVAALVGGLAELFEDGELAPLEDGELAPLEPLLALVVGPPFAVVSPPLEHAVSEAASSAAEARPNAFFID